jgi:hypothetical protein
MLRHTAFFQFKEDITPEKQMWMLKGLAYMRFECKSVVSLDYGVDIFGGSSRLREVKPFHRTPRWRAHDEGPPSNYDVALHVDFHDEAGLEAYNDDDVHHEVAQYNASVCEGELTARIDWHYDGDPLIEEGYVRHSAMFVWADEADDASRERALDHVRSLASDPSAESFTIGKNIGSLPTDFDWLFDIHMRDAAAAEALIKSEGYARVMESLAAVTKYEWAARVSHVMVGH